MIIHYGNNEQYDLTCDIRDNSVRYRKLKGEDSLTLHFSLDTFVDFPINSWVEYPKNPGLIYTLEKPENFKKKGTENFEYTLILEGAYAKLRKYKFREKTSNRFTKLKFSLTAKPHEHLQMLVDNLNERDPKKGWTVGKCIDAVEKTISYSHNNCEEVLDMIADAFDTEWEIDRKTINICKVEYFKDNPLELSYGRGNGFKPGVGRSNFNDKAPVEILYVQGGERNIDFAKYKNNELLLPKAQRLKTDGIDYSYPGDASYEPFYSREYISSSDGLSIERYDNDKGIIFNNEDSLDCSEIYPNKEHIVTGVECIDEKSKWDIFDTNNDVDYSLKDCRIAGETATIIFQSGMLAGKEFELKQTESAITGYIHSEKRFKLVSQDIDGQTMPSKIYAPKVGDKFRLFGISLPPEYVCNNDTKTGGSWDMFREAARYLYENENPQFTFTGELDSIWAKRHWADDINVGVKLKIGSYVLFSDTQFHKEGTKIRIVGIKENINNPHSPTIELSNTPASSSISSDLAKIPANEVVVEDNHKSAIQFSKRRYRDAKETIGMLEESLLENFSESINPITVQTMSMLVGDESLQFRFVDNKTNPAVMTHTVIHNTETNRIEAAAGILQHMTMGIESISSEHKSDEHKYWNLAEYESDYLTPTAKYWLYAKVTDDGRPITAHSQYTGVFERSDKAITMKRDAGYYYLLVGILNSEYNGSRGDFVPLYGFTEILPGRITTDKIVSSDGKTYFDLLNNIIGGKINFIDGLISGLIGIGNENGTNAGLCGSGASSTDTRVWVGASAANRHRAPFRVLHNGAFFATNANITGTVNANKGVLKNVIINGSLRNAFQNGEFSIGDDFPVTGNRLRDNNNVIIPGIYTEGQFNYFVIPSDIKYSGFKATIMNTDFDGKRTNGSIYNNSAIIYENGARLSRLVIPVGEGVEMIGVGDNQGFKGWIITNRISFTESRVLRILASYEVHEKGVIAKRYGEKADYVNSVTSPANTSGVYVVPHNIGHTNYTVSANAHQGAHPCYCTVSERTNTSVTIKISTYSGNYQNYGFDVTFFGTNG